MGALSYDPRGFVWWGSLVITLTAAQHLLLGSLVQAGGRYVTRATLAERIGSDGDGNVVAVQMSRLRKNLASAGAPIDAIENVRGRGYRLNLPQLEAWPAQLRRAA